MVNKAGNNGTCNGERKWHCHPILKLSEKEISCPEATPLPVVTTLVCDKLDNDIAQGIGPEAMKTLLALDGYQIPRDTILEAMKDNAPGAAKRRCPGNKTKIPRKNLTGQGVFQELHFDGHEKLSSAALKMGQVGISIYSSRDHASGVACNLRAVPDARHAVVIRHVYLDLVLEFGVIPLQVTVDKGSETGDMFAAHIALRYVAFPSPIYTPELDPLKFPPVVALKSVNNIPIENLWKWLRQMFGRSLCEWIEDGKTNGIFNSTSEIHIHLFHWLWSQIVQNALDSFKDYWNYHKSRNNPKKDLPSGVAPLEIFQHPEAYGLAQLGVPVEREVVEALRENLDCSRHEALQWVPDYFDVAAEQVYTELKRPKLEPSRGWEIFAEMAVPLEAMGI
ncbi:hypothetical protein B0H13DRAFT_2558781 [Mycena leptocephala]|nr:hypothetical protein B0H13DRAFT_2558781 [Mycena leptocephala]